MLVSGDIGGEPSARYLQLRRCDREETKLRSKVVGLSSVGKGRISEKKTSFYEFLPNQRTQGSRRKIVC